MRTLSIRMEGQIFEEMQSMMEYTGMSQNEYINQAVNLFNQMNRRQEFRKNSQKVYDLGMGLFDPRLFEQNIGILG